MYSAIFKKTYAVGFSFFVVHITPLISDGGLYRDQLRQELMQAGAYFCRAVSFRLFAWFLVYCLKCGFYSSGAIGLSCHSSHHCRRQWEHRENPRTAPYHTREHVPRRGTHSRARSGAPGVFSLSKSRQAPSTRPRRGLRAGACRLFSAGTVRLACRYISVSISL